MVIELSDEDELEGRTLVVTIAAAAPIIPTGPVAQIALNIPGPSAPCAVGSPDTSRDEEIARKLFVELNREAISIPGDGGLVILSSDSEEEAAEEDAGEEEDEPMDSGSPSRS